MTRQRHVMGRRQHHRTHPQRAKPLHSVAEHDDRKQGIREKDGKDTQLCTTYTGAAGGEFL